MAIRIYDTLTRQLRELPDPRQQPELKIYVCGPTVYDDPHIGHARSAYVFDVIRRYLEYRCRQENPNFKLAFVRNVTDIDDKIIQKAAQTGQTVEQVAEQYLAAYHAAMDQLGIQPPTQEPKATEHIPQMQAMIKALVRKEAAYVAANGDVYFAVRAFNGYGKLSNRSVDELQAGARVESGEEKCDPLDFALWKAAKPGEPQWGDKVPNEQPALAPGRPAWHIECSAMSMQYLGETFDIHGGGVDLVFPHHENEIAQSQAFTGRSDSFAKSWIHNGLLTINGQKMSKSLGNFKTVEQALQDARRGGGKYAEKVLKIFLLTALYRSPLDYSVRYFDEIRERVQHFSMLMRTIASFHEKPEDRSHEPSGALLDEVEASRARFREEFVEKMDNDFNTPEALAVLTAMVHQANRYAHQESIPRAERWWISARYMGDINQLAEEVFGIEELCYLGDVEVNADWVEQLIRDHQKLDDQLVVPLRHLTELFYEWVECAKADEVASRIKQEYSPRLRGSWLGRWYPPDCWSDAQVRNHLEDCRDEKVRLERFLEVVQIFADVRDRFREYKRYERADQFRDWLHKVSGIQLEDTKEGTKIRLKQG